jgi:DNA-binding CsgD family transcriptional regulator
MTNQSQIAHRSSGHRHAQGLADETPAAANASDAVEASPAAAFAALEGLAQGVAVLDEVGHIDYSNPAARALLHRAGWGCADGSLRGPDATEQSAVSRALQRVCRQGWMQLVSVGGGATHAALSPVDIGPHRRALLTLGREAVCGAIELQLFAANCELTLAESRVLSHLTRGLRPAEIARLHGVRESTVLTQVASLRNKTRSTSVRDLLDHVSRLPGFAPRAVQTIALA